MADCRGLKMKRSLRYDHGYGLQPRTHIMGIVSWSCPAWSLPTPGLVTRRSPTTRWASKWALATSAPRLPLTPPLEASLPKGWYAPSEPSALPRPSTCGRLLETSRRSPLLRK